MLLANPKVLILDEPDPRVDVGAKYEIYKLMFELVKRWCLDRHDQFWNFPKSRHFRTGSS